MADNTDLSSSNASASAPVPAAVSSSKAAKVAAAEVNEVQAVEPVQEFPISLDEFCQLISRTDKRVELIAGFHFSEKRAGRLQDVESAYRVRFNQF